MARKSCGLREPLGFSVGLGGGSICTFFVMVLNQLLRGLIKPRPLNQLNSRTASG
jgi:hypothetical protein